MRLHPLIVPVFLGATTASAQTYNPPNGTQYLLNVQVTRTDIGDEVHLKVTFLAPLASKALPVCNQAFFYGWIDTSRQRLMVSQSKGEDSPYGFKAIRQPFTPGEKVTLETNLPKAFVDALGAHLHAGIGIIGGGFYPTQNLLIK